MIKMKTKSERQERLSQLNDKKNILGQTKDMQLLDRWHLLSEERKAIVRQDWADYFTQCRKTDAAENFFAMKKAFSEENMKEVRDRAAWALELRKTPAIKEPASFPVDPDLLQMHGHVIAYQAIIREINEMTFYAYDVSTTDL